MRLKLGISWLSACVAGLLVVAMPMVYAQSDSDNADNTNVEDTSTGKAAEAPKHSTATKTIVVQDDFKIDAKIVASSDQKELMGEGDFVFLNIGLDAVAPGMEGTIYRKLGKIKDKKTGETLGTQLTRVGMLVVTDEVGEKACTARITTSDDPIEVGDLVHMGK